MLKIKLFNVLKNNNYLIVNAFYYKLLKYNFYNLKINF